MERECYKKQSEILITAEKLSQANLDGFDSLELRTADHSAIVIPGEMTAVELLETYTALQSLCSDLMSHFLTTCSKCDKCGQSVPCELMTAPILPEVIVPVEDMIEAGIEPGCRLTCSADPENNRLIVQESNEGYSLADVNPTIIQVFRNTDVCLRDLERLVEDDPIIYPEFQSEDLI